jgi:hypothetical protein
MKMKWVVMMLLLCCRNVVNAAKIAVISDKELWNYTDLLTAEMT